MTVIAFTPSPSAPFQFLATLDGIDHNVTITWNVYRQDWYLNIFEQSGARIITTALVGSPHDYDISLTAGYFSSSLVYRSDARNFEITP